MHLLSVKQTLRFCF